jgi:hypothetical protein
MASAQEARKGPRLHLPEQSASPNRRPARDPSAACLAFFSSSCGRASDADSRVIPEIGSAHRPSDPVELYSTPAAPTLGGLQFGTARYMTDCGKICPRSGDLEQRRF